MKIVEARNKHPISAPDLKSPEARGRVTKDSEICLQPTCLWVDSNCLYC